MGSFVDQEPNPQTQLTPASSCVVKRLVDGQVIALQRPLRGGRMVELCGIRVRVRVGLGSGLGLRLGLGLGVGSGLGSG